MSRTNPFQKKQTGALKQTGLARRLPGLTAAALATAGCLLPMPPAHAAGAVYQQHTLNAGVLVNGTGPASDPAPYLFYVLNNRPDIRPADLNLINPLAPPGTLSNAAAYWEVSLNNVTDSQLTQYNILYLPASSVTIPPAVNEKLRRYVDNGGQLLVEYEQANTFNANVPPQTTTIAAGLFTGTGAASGSGSVGFPPTSVPATPYVYQPIVAQPYLFNQSDLTALGSPAFYLIANAADAVHSSEYGNLFSPALVVGNNAVVSTAQLGAGQIVASTLNIGGGISIGNAATFVPTDLYNNVSTFDLKLLSNIITWSEAHPNENKTAHGNASASGLASFSPAWQYPVVSGNAASPAPAGAAVWGNFVFVNDANGLLHAFNAYPGQTLTGAPSTTYPGNSFDEIWNSNKSPAVTLGVNSSVPTVASINGVNYVFVEKSDGSVVGFNAVTKAAYPALNPPALPSGYSAASYPAGGVVNAPSPTVYDGRLYAGQANGTLCIYDLTGTAQPNNPVAIPLNATMTAGEAVLGPPAVGTVANGDTTILTATVSTSFNVYTVLLGARNDALKPTLPGAATSGYSINRSPEYGINSIFADIGSVAPKLQAYDYNGLLQPGASVANTTPPAPQDPLFTGGAAGGYYTDWNMDFYDSIGGQAASTGGGYSPVNLLSISANSYQAAIGAAGAAPAAGTPPTAIISAPVVDRQGDYYYTETNRTNVTNSYLVGVSNSAQRGNIHLKFRFRLPTTADSMTQGSFPGWSYVDGDGVDYKRYNLIDYHFVGAPAVDDQGNVYAAAVDKTGTLATVLCFRGNQQATSETSAADLTDDTIVQPDEEVLNTENTIVRGPDITTPGVQPIYGQFIGSPTSLSFYNFGHFVPGQSQQIAGNLCEPQPIYAKTDSPTAYTQLKLHTNLAWYVPPFTVYGSVTGLTQVGSSVFLTDGVNLYRMSTKPQTTLKATVTSPTPTSLGANGTAPGTVGAPPSVGGSVMVIAGTNAIAVRTRQVTVIADNDRVLGVDGDGAAIWAVDATTRTDLTTNAATKVPFSHPTALSQFALNDYLAADTGNNRCVRFDTSGNVQWELTRFTDLYGLMASGQPVTLSQPTSVVVRVLPDPDTANPGGSYTYYLVADSGNDRVVEVCDRLTAQGNIYVDPAKNSTEVTFNHVLTWVSHTADTFGRRYRYGSAAYYFVPNAGAAPSIYIAATVGNTRIGALTAQAAPLTGFIPGPTGGDGPGGSLAVFRYPSNPAAVTTSNPLGLIPYNASGQSDLAYTTAGFLVQNAQNALRKYTPLSIRSPRFLQLYTPALGAAPAAPASGAPAFDFLYADDNGVFDLTYDTAQKAFVAGQDRLQFTPANYAAMTVPTDAPTTGTPGANYVRTGLPFVPTCVQGLSIDTQGTGVSTVTTRRYLITQSYSQGELGTPSATGKIGGEVFEVDVTNPVPAGAFSQTAVGGFGGNVTLSHPALTGPLTQPTFAVRLP